MLAQPVHNAEQRFLNRSDGCVHQFRDLLAGHSFLVLHQKHEPLAFRHGLQQLQDLLDDQTVVYMPADRSYASDSGMS